MISQTALAVRKTFIPTPGNRVDIIPEKATGFTQSTWDVVQAPSDGPPGILDEIRSPVPMVNQALPESPDTSSLKSEPVSANYPVAIAAAIYAINKSYEEQSRILSLLA